MILAKVVATVVATEKHAHYVGHKLLMVQPLDAYGELKGKPIIAVDGVQAGIGDRVLVVDEGGSARNVVGDEKALTIRTAICGIVDSVDIEDRA
ncbi:MAG: EutN/CcmL family microcompartment protein [Spirochaetes bacterium]|nr:EutN/CcmL family microcompartment protein [Spirochaetota bacterium]